MAETLPGLVFEAEIRPRADRSSDRLTGVREAPSVAVRPIRLVQCANRASSPAGIRIISAHDTAPTPDCCIGPASLVEFSGADASAFAHAQFTSDVATLAPGHWHWSAWLDARGRVRNVFALLHVEPGRLVAWLPRGDAGRMATSLSMYVLRAKVGVRTLDGWHRFDAGEAVQGTAMTIDPGDGWTLAMPGTPRRRLRLAPAEGSATFVDARRQAAWDLADVRAGLPWVADEVCAEFVPPALGLERLGAVRLDKGCYPGQEIVARLHYRGGNKRHAAHLLLDAAPASTGTGVVADAESAATGTVLYAAWSAVDRSEAIAILPDALLEASGLRLDSGARVAQVSAYAVAALFMPQGS